MAIIKQSTYSNISPFPKSWYQASGNWAAKTVVDANDRYTLQSPEHAEIDVDDIGLTNSVVQEIDLSVSTNWAANAVTRADSTQYNVGDLAVLPDYIHECTTAGVSGDEGSGLDNYNLTIAYNSLTYDSTLKVFWLFGGQVGSTAVNSLYKYTIATQTWELISDASGTPPTGREYHTTVFDSANNALLIFGGVNAALDSAATNTIHKYDIATNTWSTLSPSSPPSARYGHNAVYDSKNAKMLLFGGYNMSTRVQDLWAYDIAANTWTQNTGAGGSYPPARYVSGCAYIPDASNPKFLILGGNPSASVANCYCYDITGDSWSALNSMAAARTYITNCSYHVATDSVYVFGGAATSSSDMTNTLYKYVVGTNTWSTLSPTGTVPAARSRCATAIDPIAGNIHIIGGVGYVSSAYVMYSDSHVYNITGNAWTKISFPTTVSETITDGSVTWTCRYANPTLAASRAGQNFYLYACHSSDGTNRPTFKVSPNSTIPYGYTADNSRKIGGFHCLCVAMSTPATRANSTPYLVGKTVVPATPTGYWYRCVVAGTSDSSPPTFSTTIDGTTADGAALVWITEPIHPASGYLAGDIIPNSVWDLKHRAKSGDNTGLAYIDALDDWAGIYLVSGTATAPTNVYGGTILNSINWNDAFDAAGVIKSRLPRDSEFQVLARLSNEQTNILGGVTFTTTGGHSDTEGRRMLSKYFIEDCAGGLQHWLDEEVYKFYNATAHQHVWTLSGAQQPDLQSAVANADVSPAWTWTTLMTGYKGQKYVQQVQAPLKMRAGGDYSSATACGSRNRTLNAILYNGGTSYGFRVIVSNCGL